VTGNNKPGGFKNVVDPDLLKAKGMVSRAKLAFEQFSQPTDPRPVVIENYKWHVKLAMGIEDDILATVIRPIVQKHLDAATAEILAELSHREEALNNKACSMLAGPQVEESDTKTTDEENNADSSKHAQ
jgi:hypothetical protein